ncbi:hypothetical protein QBC46DRAFT_127847 [Diplogelasinospora grovesii]|uniref:Uncharacterized protein n=1 Tax=Diplogelasinospora grovesii TaxID=303347 RepID=A0AAN6N8T2_9PEZI|nr:hypothetical protein QBC46DRAFT_127847 [Diplogelasinospora grovesii]
MWDARRKLREEFGAPPGEVESQDNGTEHLQALLGCLSDQEREKLEKAMFQDGGPGWRHRGAGDSSGGNQSLGGVTSVAHHVIT